LKGFYSLEASRGEAVQRFIAGGLFDFTHNKILVVLGNSVEWLGLKV